MNQKIMPPICMTCGRREDINPTSDLCVNNQHDDWLEQQDVIDRTDFFVESAKKLKISEEALRSLFMNPHIQQIYIPKQHYNPKKALKALCDGVWDDPDLLAYGPIGPSIKYVEEELLSQILDNARKVTTLDEIVKLPIKHSLFEVSPTTIEEHYYGGLHPTSKGSIVLINAGNVCNLRSEYLIDKPFLYYLTFDDARYACYAAAIENVESMKSMWIDDI